MGRRNSQKKSAVMWDSDDNDDASSITSSSSLRSDRMSVLGTDEMEPVVDNLLDKALDNLYEKRGSMRETALASILDAFNSNIQHQFVEEKFATLLHQCLSSMKRGSSKEISLACHVIGLLALTVGTGDNAREIIEESLIPLSQALKSGTDSSRMVSIINCLAIITFVCGNDVAETERSMEIMWHVVHPKLGSNVLGGKPSPTIITAVVSAWTFLLTTTGGWTFSFKHMQESFSYFLSLMDKDDRSVRIAAGEALALVFEIGSIEKFSSEANNDSGQGEKYKHMHGLRAKFLNQVKNLSVEAGGKGSAKKDLNSQRNLFKDILEYLEDDISPETSIKIGGDTLETSTWSQLIQLNFLRHFLGGGFIKHMQENEFLHDVFGFTPKRRLLNGPNQRMSGGEKRLFKSPNSAVNKARTQYLSKQRMLSKDKNLGHYAVGLDGEV